MSGSRVCPCARGPAGRRRRCVAAAACRRGASPGAGHDLQLGPCPRVPALCGRLTVPRWWSQPREGQPLSIRFRVYPRTDTGAPAETPIVAFEGGPGYGSIGSADSYRFLFAPLLRASRPDPDGPAGDWRLRHDRLPGPAELRRGTTRVAVGECADAAGCRREQLRNRRGRRRSGRDPARARRAEGRGVRRLVRHLHRADVRAAAPVDGRRRSCSTAPTTIRSIRSRATRRRRFGGPGRRCAAAPAPARHHRGDRARLAQLDRHPLVGVGVDSSGTPHRIRLTGSASRNCCTTRPTCSRSIATSPRRWTRGGTATMRRCCAWLRRTWAPSAAAATRVRIPKAPTPRSRVTTTPRSGSARADLEDRREQLQAAIDGLAPNSFAPFSNESWLDSLYEDQLVRGCIRWPALARGDAPTPDPRAASAHPGAGARRRVRRHHADVERARGRAGLAERDARAGCERDPRERPLRLRGLRLLDRAAGSSGRCRSATRPARRTPRRSTSCRCSRERLADAPRAHPSGPPMHRRRWIAAPRGPPSRPSPTRSIAGGTSSTAGGRSDFAAALHDARAVLLLPAADDHVPRHAIRLRPRPCRARHRGTARSRRQGTLHVDGAVSGTIPHPLRHRTVRARRRACAGCSTGIRRPSDGSRLDLMIAFL